MQEHMMTETLIRYFMMMSCVGIITWLVFTFFEWGPYSLGIGLCLCLAFLLVKQLQRRIEAGKKKDL